MLDCPGACACIPQRSHHGRAGPPLVQPPAQAAQQMWRLVVQQAGLAQHLAALRRYLLLGQGDFYHAFLTLVCGLRACVDMLLHGLLLLLQTACAATCSWGSSDFYHAFLTLASVPVVTCCCMGCCAAPDSMQRQVVAAVANHSMPFSRATAA